jgi:uncharacterized SAM-binding protein YcdF (DUF218 family)
MTYDAIIVLANMMDRVGILNKESSLRANLAAKLMVELNVPYIITCGWACRRDSSIYIADAFKSYLISIGISSDKIITEINSRDTVGDAVFTKKNVSEPMGFNNLCIVTSNYHIPRTSKIFNFVYGSNYTITVEGANLNFNEALISKELESECAFKRTFSNVDAGNFDQIMNALRSNHPFYNGDIYPII